MYSEGLWRRRKRLRSSNSRESILQERRNIGYLGQLSPFPSQSLVVRSRGVSISRPLLERFKEIFTACSHNYSETVGLVDFCGILHRSRDSLISVSSPDEVDEIFRQIDVFATFGDNSFTRVTWSSFLDELKRKTAIVLPPDYQPSRIGREVTYETYRDALLQKGILADTHGAAPSGLSISTPKFVARSPRFEFSPNIAPNLASNSASLHFKSATADLLAQYRQHVSAPDRSVIDRVTTMMSEGPSHQRKELFAPMDTEDDNMYGLSSQELIEERLNSGGSAAELSAVKTILNGPPSPDVIINKFNVEFLRKDMCCLKSATWLNDEVINFYMQMLQERDQAMCAKYCSRLPSYYFSSFFMERLLVTDHKYNYRNVARWSRKIDAFAMKTLYFPINISNTHWTLATISIVNKTITYYDSMSGHGTMYLKGLLQWLQDEAADQYKDAVKTRNRQGKPQEVVNVDDWKLVSPQRGQVPQQANGFDCGVFTIVCADFLSDDLPLKYSQQHMPYFRLKIACDIKRGNLKYTV